MKHRLSILLVLPLMLATAGWRSDNDQKQTAILPIAAATPNCTPIGLIIRVENDSQINAGKELCPDDPLQPVNGANATVLCYAEGKIWNVPSGQTSRATSGCSLVLARRVCIRGKCTVVRSPELNPNTPRIISPPPNTELLNDRPILHWSAVQGIKSYSVRLEGPGVNWEKKVNDNKLLYPTDKPSLKPGFKYTLIVEVNKDKPDENALFTKAVFGLLSPEKAQRVKDAAQQIAMLKNLTDEQKAINLARLYGGSENNLLSDAIETLKLSVKNGSQTALVYRMLGDLYLKIERPELANDPYSQAVKLAQDAKDLNELAAAQAGLGEVNRLSENWNEAIRWLKESQATYETLLKNMQVATELAQLLGVVYLDNQNRDEAFRWFQKAKAGYENLEKTPENKQRLREVERQLEKLKR